MWARHMVEGDNLMKRWIFTLRIGGWQKYQVGWKFFIGVYFKDVTNYYSTPIIALEIVIPEYLDLTVVNLSFNKHYAQPILSSICSLLS